MVYLFIDNCSAQNKNKLLFEYLSAVINKPINNILCIDILNRGIAF